MCRIDAGRIILRERSWLGAGSGNHSRAIPDLLIVGRLHPSMRPESKQRRKALSEHQITCVLKQDPNNPSSGITDLGNPGVGWIRKRQEIISNIHRGDVYFTMEGGKRALVTIQGVAPNEYLQTIADKSSPNNLGNLPPCRAGLRSS